ncbi:phage tail protein I [Poseidonibacter lekithochrous]|uniref:phage tail protein I n=1 Tax=Poseidonibacter lekithochrous TaxID=1904463 RepID=UPI000D3AD79D|nr:phage tail protein I [Poseidonibacter lekithochrous]
MEQTSLIPSFESKELHSTDLVAAGVVSKLNDEIQAIKTLANPLTCEVKYLPFLAHAFKVDFWDESLDENDKRNLIQSSILLHQRKGTIWAIEKVFEALNMKAVVKEWFDYAGEPYHFKIDLSLEDKEITPGRITQLTKYIDIYKNVRSVLDELIISYLQKQKINIASGGVGEVSCNSEMLEGYESISVGTQKINLGAVGEVSSYAVQI